MRRLCLSISKSSYFFPLNCYNYSVARAIRPQFFGLILPSDEQQEQVGEEVGEKSSRRSQRKSLMCVRVCVCVCVLNARS